MMKPLPMATPLVPNEPMSGDEEQMTYGLKHCHNQMIRLTQQIFSAAAQTRTLTKVLNRRGLISDEEMAEQRVVEERELMALFSDKKVGVRLNNVLPDKYNIPPAEIPRIDCENRLPLCRGACCALRFSLSGQDLEEGVVRWTLSEPYLNRQGLDGRCVHQDREGLGCTIHEHRPSVCRVYSCRDDARIWLDFDKRVINPDLFAEGPDGEQVLQFPPPPDGMGTAEQRMDTVGR